MGDVGQIVPIPFHARHQQSVRLSLCHATTFFLNRPFFPFFFFLLFFFACRLKQLCRAPTLLSISLAAVCLRLFVVRAPSSSCLPFCAVYDTKNFTIEQSTIDTAARIAEVRCRVRAVAARH